MGDTLVIHNGKNIEQSFEDFDQAERFIKRNFGVSLCFDDECLKILAGSLSINLEEVKGNYLHYLKKVIDKLSK